MRLIANPSRKHKQAAILSIEEEDHGIRFLALAEAFCHLSGCLCKSCVFSTWFLCKWDYIHFPIIGTYLGSRVGLISGWNVVLSWSDANMIWFGILRECLIEFGMGVCMMSYIMIFWCWVDLCCGRYNHLGRRRVDCSQGRNGFVMGCPDEWKSVLYGQC